MKHTLNHVLTETWTETVGRTRISRVVYVTTLGALHFGLRGERPVQAISARRVLLVFHHIPNTES